MSSNPEAPEKGKDFIRQIIDRDMESGKYHGRVHTRFPPEPNGYLHIGHAKSICLNFGLARDYEGKCNLRFDDTNPVKEDVEYVDSIREDVRWLGFDWDNNFYASNYFEKLYFIAELFIKMGKAYVDHQSADEIRENRGTLKEPGKASPYRDRTVEENLALFRAMRAGELKDGECILRGKIDMAAPNVMLRDPALYRIKHADHHRTGSAWCIYPMYDFTHGLSDAIEGITHSICTLEFENNRPLYDWCVDTLMEGLRQPELFGENAAIYNELAALPGFTDRPRQRALQAQAHPVGPGRVRERLGRPAHADHLRGQAARIHARVHPRLLRADRRGQGGLHGRIRPARGLPARRPEQTRPPLHGHHGPGQAGHRKLP